jgi:hypothetical protein
MLIMVPVGTVLIMVPVGTVLIMVPVGTVLIGKGADVKSYPALQRYENLRWQ